MSGRSVPYDHGKNGLKQLPPPPPPVSAAAPTATDSVSTAIPKLPRSYDYQKLHADPEQSTTVFTVFSSIGELLWDHIWWILFLATVFILFKLVIPRIRRKLGEYAAKREWRERKGKMRVLD